MSGSRFSGGSGAQAGGSGFSNTSTSGSTSIQLKKLTMKTAAGKLVISPDQINFLITGEDGQFYDSKYKGDQISLPVTSKFDRSSSTGSSSLNIDKNGLAVPVFDTNFGDTNIPSGTIHAPYTRQIKIDTNGLAIPYTDVILGILSSYSYTRTQFLGDDGSTMNCPDISDLEVGISSGTHNLAAINRPQFDLTTGGGDPNTIYIDTITLTVSGTSAQIDSITCYSEGTKLKTGDRLYMSNNELLNKLSLNNTLREYFRPYIFNTTSTRFTQTSNIILTGSNPLSSNTYSTTTLTGSGSGLTVYFRAYEAIGNDPRNIQEIIPVNIGSGYAPGTTIKILQSDILSDPSFDTVSGDVTFTVLDNDFPIKANITGNSLSFVINSSQITSAPSYHVRDFSMTTAGISFPVNVPRFSDNTKTRKELATIGSSGYFLPTRYTSNAETTTELFKITPNGLFGPGANSDASFTVYDNGNFFFNPNSGGCKFYNVTANEITATIKQTSQNSITTMTGLTSFGADSVNTTCNGTLIVTQGIRGTISSLNASQPNITTLDGLVSIGTAGQTITNPGNFTVSQTFTANGSIVLGPSATLTANNISGTLTGSESANQPNILTLAGLTSIGSSGQNVALQGSLSANNITSSTGTFTASKIRATTSLSGVLTAFDTNDTSTAIQPNITTLAGVTSFGTFDATTTCAGSLTVTQTFTTSSVTATNLTGTIKTAVQEEITTLAGVTSIGTNSVETVFKGNNLNANAGSVTAANGIYGTIKTGSQSDITALTGVTTIGASTATTGGNWIVSGYLNANNGGQIGATTPLSSLSATTITGTLNTAQQHLITSIAGGKISETNGVITIDGNVEITGTQSATGTINAGTTTNTLGWIHLFSNTPPSNANGGGIKLGTGQQIYIEFSSVQWRFSHEIVMQNNGTITLGTAPTNGNHAATKTYVDTQVNPTTLQTTLGGYFVKYTGAQSILNMNTNKITGLPSNPSHQTDAISKGYLESILGTQIDPKYLPITGGTLIGNIVLHNTTFKVRGLGDTASFDDEAVSKKFIDDTIANYIKKDGSVALTGTLQLGGNTITNIGAPTGDTDAVNRTYLLDNVLGASNSYFGYIKRDGSSGEMKGNFDFGNNNITNLKTPSNNNDASTKKYVDDAVTPIQTTVNTLGTTYLKLDGTNLTTNLSLGNRKITNLSAPTEDAEATNKIYVDEAIAGGISGIDDTTRRINGLTGRICYNEFREQETNDQYNRNFNTIRGELAKLRNISDNEERIDYLESNFSTRINSIQGIVSLKFDDHNERITIIEQGDHKRLNTMKGDIISTQRDIEEIARDTHQKINSIRGDILQQLTDFDRINSLEGKTHIMALTVSDSEQSIKTLQTNTASNLSLINSNIQRLNTVETQHIYRINELQGKIVSQNNRFELLEFLTEKRINTFEGKLLSLSNFDDIHFRINTIEGNLLQINNQDTLESRINTIEGKLINNNTDENNTERLNTLEGQIKNFVSFDPDTLYSRINSSEGNFTIKLTDHQNKLELLDTKFDSRINTIEGKISTQHEFADTRINTVEGAFNIKLTDHQNKLDLLDTKFDNRVNTIEGAFNIKLTDHQNKLDLLDTKFDSRINTIEGKFIHLDNNDILPRINTIEGNLINLERFNPDNLIARINTLEGTFKNLEIPDMSHKLLSLEGSSKNIENNINFLESNINTRFNTLEGKIKTQHDTTEPRINTLEGSISTETSRAQQEEDYLTSRINTIEGALVNKTTTDSETTDALEKTQTRITNSIRGEFTGKIRELQEDKNETDKRLNTLEGAIAMKTGGADEEHSHDSGTTLSGSDAFTSASAATDINMGISSGMEISAAVSKMDLWLFSYLFDKPPVVSSVTATSYPTYVDVQWTNPAQLQAAFMAIKLPHIVNIIVQIQVQSQNTWTNVVDSVIANQTNRAQLYLTSSSVSESSGATYVKKVLQTGTNYNLRIYADNLSDRALNYYSHGTLIATLSIGIPSLIRNLNLSSASSSSITIIFTNPQRFNTNLGNSSSQNNEPNLDNFVITWSPTGLQTPGNRYNAQDNYSTTGSYNLNASVQTQNGTHTRNLSNSLPPNYKFDVSVKVKNVENTTGGTNNDGYSDTVTSSFNTSDLAYSVSTLGNISVSGTQYTGRALNDTSHSNIFSSKPSSLNNIGYFRINNAIGTQSASVTTMKSYIGTSAPGASDWVALGNLDGFPVKGYSAFSNANISATPSVSDQETDPYKTGYWLKANLSSLNFDAGLTINENTTYTVGIQQTIGGSAVSKTDNFIYETGLQQPVAGNMYAHEITGSTIFRYVSGIPMISSGTSWGFSVNMQHVARFFFPQNRRLFLIKIQNSGSNVGSSIYLNSNTATFYEITALSDNKVTTTYSTPNDGSPFREFTQFQSTITFSPSNALYEDLSVYGLPYSIWNTYNGGSNTASTGKYGTTGKTLRSDQKSYNIIDNWNTSSKGTWYKITADPHGLSGLSSSGSVATYDHENCGFFRNDDRNLHMYNGELRFPATNNYTGYHLPSYNWGAWSNTDFNYTSVTGGRTAMYTALNNNSSSTGTYRYVLFRYQNVLNNADRTDNLNIVIHGISDSSGSSNVTSPKTSGVTPFNIVNNFELFIKLDGTISSGKVGGSAVESGWWDVNHGAMNLAYQFGNVTNHIGTGNGGGVCQAISYSSGNLNYEAKFPADTVADVWVLVGTTNTVAFDYISIS